VQRVFHPVAVHFKGSGFYTTDYGSRKRQRETKEGAESGAQKTETKAGERSAEKAAEGTAPKKSETTKSD
jgi:hypothetical protein